jgi:hypothetical protein
MNQLFWLFAFLALSGTAVLVGYLIVPGVVIPPSDPAVPAITVSLSAPPSARFTGPLTINTNLMRTGGMLEMIAQIQGLVTGASGVEVQSTVTSASPGIETCPTSPYKWTSKSDGLVHVRSESQIVTGGSYQLGWDICWKLNPPLTTAHQYLKAVMPYASAIYSPPPKHGLPIALTERITGSWVNDYVIQSASPKYPGYQQSQWIWDPARPDNPPRIELAISQNALQAASQLSVTAGVLFGLAGGFLLLSLQELRKIL